MKKKNLFTAAFISLLASGCATHTSTFEAFQAQDLNPMVASGQYIQKADNFFVLNDSSSSMNDDYHGSIYVAQPTPNKFSVEKEILSRMNLTIPNLKMTTSIRSFGYGDCLSWGFTQLNYPPTDYSQSTFDSGINTLKCASGGTPISSGLSGTTEDLAGTSGNIAVVILSDGHNLDSNGIAEVKAMKQRYGDRLCVYSIWVGNHKEKSGQQVLQQLSDVAGCGFSTNAETIASADGMADFVKQVFLKQGNPVPVCTTLDSDSDGINDCDDKCPNTLPGTHVNEYGCWIVDIKFDNDSAVIKRQYFHELEDIATAIQQHPNVKIEVQGHTSSTGSAQHNMGLSIRRAEAVKKFLVEKSNSSNITSRGYGLNNPMYSNATEEGRAKNRRVQLEIINK